MKTQYTKLLMLFTLITGVWACDNYEIPPVVDTPPSITLRPITSGLVEGQDFRMEVILSDGVEGSSISTLESLSYNFIRGGVIVLSGSEALTTDNATVTISVPGGFEPGDFTLDLTVRDTNGNATSTVRSFTVASLRPAFDITGTWQIEPVAGSLAVGPGPGNGEWFSISQGDVATRACFYDDTYTFGADGSFKIEMGDLTWLETWQGVGSDQCGTPVAPFDGKGTYQYSYTGNTLTVIGEGAFIGLAKVHNAGEISNGVPAQDEITYTIVDPVQAGNTRRMTLRIEAGAGVWWDFKLISGEIGGGEEVSLVGDWKMEPIAGSFGVGPTEGSTEWFANSAADVTTRACFFDDVYTFGADGSFSYEMGTQTWLEAWQGVVSDTCGTPVAPHDGKGTYSYTFDGTSLTLIGEGAHVALPKAVNAGELPNVDVPDSVTYKVISLTESGGVKKMTLHIETGSGVWWTFKLISE